LLISINIRHKTRAGIKVTGLSGETGFGTVDRERPPAHP
jgi:hypothetical protein